MKKIIFVMLFASVFIGCFDKEEKDIKIGFIAGLTGKYSSLGTDIRNGFLLAFDEINYKINGKKIDIIQKDDKQDPKIAKTAINEFVTQGVKLIVGNTTSSMTKISIPIINAQKDTLLISASASSSEFGAKDDNFLRVQVELSKQIYENFIKYLLDNNLKTISFIYDSKNKSYVENYEKNFQLSFVEKGGEKFVNTIDINSDFKDILAKLKSKKTDLILVVANSFDSAKFIQFLRLNNVDTKVASAAWAKTPDFIENGGKTVEGVLFNTAYNDNSKNESFLNFVSKYNKQYGTKPSVFAAQAYELGKILILELQKQTTLKNLKERIIKTQKYKGLQGEIVFNKFGDVSREYFLMEVKNGEFMKVNKRD